MVHRDVLGLWEGNVNMNKMFVVRCPGLKGTIVLREKGHLERDAMKIEIWTEMPKG